MNKQQLNRVTGIARELCAQSGGRLTDKRKSILEVLLISAMPLSAYEIADAHNSKVDKAMPVMSVYRILEFLESQDLVHRLSSANKYIACSHVICGQTHKTSQFLICDQCQSAKEIAISKRVLDEITKLVGKAGYALTNPQLELQCVCHDCAGSTSH